VKDREFLYIKVQNGELFSSLSEFERSVVWEKVLYVSRDRLIPSLRTFFGDCNYLRGLLNCIIRLVQRSQKDTVLNSLTKAFSDVNQQPDQCII